MRSGLTAPMARRTRMVEVLQSTRLFLTIDDGPGEQMVADRIRGDGQIALLRRDVHLGGARRGDAPALNSDNLLVRPEAAPQRQLHQSRVVSLARNYSRCGAANHGIRVRELDG